jgi:hypothetical protein
MQINEILNILLWCAVHHVAYTCMEWNATLPVEPPAAYTSVGTVGSIMSVWLHRSEWLPQDEFAWNYIEFPTHYRTRHWKYCNEIWTGVSSSCKKWRGVSVVRLIVATRSSGPPASGKIIKEMPGSVTSGTPYIFEIFTKICGPG